jgi:hypothetical protein
MSDEKIRKFESGATRNSDHGKYDYEAFNCPLVDEFYAKFMHGHRFLEDGTMRDGDNWQKGIPVDQLLKSLARHFMDVRLHHRGFPEKTVETMEDSLCAIIFGAKAMLRAKLLEAKPKELHPYGLPGKHPDGTPYPEDFWDGLTQTTHQHEDPGVGVIKDIQLNEDLGELLVFGEEGMATYATNEDGDLEKVEPYGNVVEVPTVEPEKPHFYIAGPMRGYYQYNFSAFDVARDFGISLGYDITSPADIDRSHGIDPTKDWEGAKKIVDAWTQADLRAVVARDLMAIIQLKPERGDGLAVIPQWEDSTGCMAEIAVANWLGLKVVSVEDFKTPLPRIQGRVAGFKLLVDGLLKATKP